MRNDDGVVVSDLDTICQSWTDFYSSLFSACDIDSNVQADLLSNVSSFPPTKQVSVGVILLSVRFMLPSSVWPGASLPGPTGSQ